MFDENNFLADWQSGVGFINTGNVAVIWTLCYHYLISKVYGVYRMKKREKAGEENFVCRFCKTKSGLKRKLLNARTINSAASG
jgi:hypothetical protein